MKGKGRRRRFFRLLVAVLVVGGAVWWRLAANNNALKAELRAKGERITFEELGLDRPPFEDPARPVLEAVEEAFGEIRNATNRTGATWNDVRSQSPWVLCRQPVLYSASGGALDWDRAAEAADRVSAAMGPLYELLRDPPADPGSDYQSEESLPFVRVRSTAQALFDLAMIELKRERVAAAQTNLLALASVPGLYRAAPLVVSHMVRTATCGLASEAIWQGLQSPGWSEDQLRELQDRVERLELLAGLVEGFETERAGILQLVQRYRTQGPSALHSLYTAMGLSSPPWWREQLAFGYWRLFRYPPAERELILTFQDELDRDRQLAGGSAWTALPPRRAQAVPWAWRASIETWLQGANGRKLSAPIFEAPKFLRVSERTVEVEIRRRLALTALGLARYRLARGNYPDRLDELVPDYLKTALSDPVDGQPFRYRREDPQFPRLYSIGLNGRDDGGWGVGGDPDSVWDRPRN